MKRLILTAGFSLRSRYLGLREREWQVLDEIFGGKQSLLDELYDFKKVSRPRLQQRWVLWLRFPFDGAARVHAQLAVDYRLMLAERARLLRLEGEADRLLGMVGALLPARVTTEEIGDALEDIRRRVAEGRPAAEIRLKIYASVLWAVWHAFVYELRGFTRAIGRKGG